MGPLSGIIVAMVTPMTDDQQISYDRTEKLLDSIINKGISGIFILGTNGEAYLLSEKEKLKFSRFVIDYVRDKVKVIVGTGLNGTAETISFSERISELKPDALSLVGPGFVAPTQSELINHYQRVADAVSVPMMMYNMPAKTGINIDPESLKILSQHENIIGIKDSSGNLDNLQGYLDNRNSKDFSVLVGSDSKILPFLKMGGDGAIAATANLLTKNDVQLYNSYREGNLEKAQTCQDNIDPLRKVLHRSTTPVSLKAVLTESGVNVGPARLPAQMPDSNSELMNEVKKVVKYYRTSNII